MRNEIYRIRYFFFFLCHKTLTMFKLSQGFVVQNENAHIARWTEWTRVESSSCQIIGCYSHFVLFYFVLCVYTDYFFLFPSSLNRVFADLIFAYFHWNQTVLVSSVFMCPSTPFGSDQVARKPLPMFASAKSFRQCSMQPHEIWNQISPSIYQYFVQRIICISLVVRLSQDLLKYI